MSTDLWPAEVQAENPLTPEDILNEQAEFLRERTDGLLTVQIKSQPHPDGRVITFDVVAERIPSTVHLLEVYQHPNFDYPAAIVVPQENVPAFMKGPKKSSALARGVAEYFEKKFGTSQDTILATTPKEFSEQIQQVFARPLVKGLVLSLLARSNKVVSAADESS